MKHLLLILPLLLLISLSSPSQGTLSAVFGGEAPEERVSPPSPLSPRQASLRRLEARADS